MLFGRSRNLVGLDIGDSSIKVVQLKDLGRGRGLQVSRLGWEPLSAEAIVDGAIMDSQLVSDTIQRLFERCRIKSSTPVAIALSGHSVIIKRISLPQMNEAELAESIHWEAEQYIPFDIEDVNLDYKILEGSSLSGEGNMDILLAAAKKEKINDYVGVVGQAGLEAATVDIAAFAIQNAFEANYDLDPSRTAALVDIGAAVTSITVLHGGNSVYWRDINVGGNQYTDQIQKELNLSAEQAERLKRGEEIDGLPYERVLPIISAVNDDVGTEIQKTLDFFRQISATDEGLDRLFLSGGTAQVVHLKEALGERLDCQVELLNPFRKIPPAGREVSPELVNEMLPTASVAVGLALRKVGGLTMIRINLLSEKKKAGKARGAGAPAAGLQLQGLGAGRNAALVAILALGVVVAAGWWWMLDREAGEWQAKLKEADQEIKRLEAAIKKGQEYEAQKALLARKIDLITNLKKQQAVPVHILDKVSRSLPDFLWLDTMSASNNQISISGKATTYNAVSNFYSNLNDSGYFDNVTLGRTFEVPEGVSFSLTCSFAGQRLDAAAAQQS